MIKQPQNNPNNLCFYGSSLDKDFLPVLKSYTGGRTCFVRLDKVTTLTEVKMYCQSKGITGIISTSVPLLQKLLYWDKRAAPALNDYAGSYFRLDDIEIVFVHPLKQAYTVPYGRFLLKRFCDKLVRPGDWMAPIEFNWSVLTPESFDHHFEKLKSAFIIAVDIETLREDAQIRCVAFCGFYYTSNGGILSFATVLPLDSDYALTLLRKLCWELKAPKVFQNGKYDINYLLRYNAPVYNYLLDTANMHHCWYSELPKDLGSLNSFYVRESRYWKDMAETTDLHEYYHYNALDTYATGVVAIIWLLTAPAWAKNNYLLEFPNVFPCILAEMTGIKRDMSRLAAARAEQEAIDASLTASLRTMIGEPNFNPASPKQVLQLMHVLGCKDLTSSGEKMLNKAKFRHPLNVRILDPIVKIRKARKLISNYLTTGNKAKEFKGRVLYALNPHGTDTSRLASKEHHFWCGLQMQNQPRGKIVKQTYVADTGFYIAEVDLAQAESRDTGYISGEEKLIDAVEHSPDFHSHNASAFFGIPFEEIYDAVNSVVLNKPIRQISKNVNHGANYNMGAYILIETMGEENILKARNLLNLPKMWGYKEIAEHLLAAFHKTYPGIRSVFYEGVKEEIGRTKMLVSQAVHHPIKNELYPDDSIKVKYTLSPEAYERAKELNPAWTRYCFGDPSKSKPQLNAYIAHPPQSLNAQTLNIAWQKVFHTIAINPKHSNNFKLCAQIHDSILFQYREGHEYLCDMVKDCMEIPVTLRGYDGKIRTFTVPADIKKGKINKDTGKLVLARYWSETE